jgi:hypothetical protein
VQADRVYLIVVSVLNSIGIHRIEGDEDRINACYKQKEKFWFRVSHCL